MTNDKYKSIGKHQTKIYSEDGFLNVKYWYTDVFKMDENKFILNSGGHQTNTTKRRINQCFKQFNLNCFLYQKSYNWFLNYGGVVIEFKDNIEIPINLNSDLIELNKSIEVLSRK